MRSKRKGFNPLAPFYTDAYKLGHNSMIAPNATKLYGTWIPRSFKHAPKNITKVVSFGQQLMVTWLHDLYQNNFFDRPLEDSLIFSRDISLCIGVDYNGKHFEDLHKLGYLPIRIKALPEGIETHSNIPHITFINTVDGYAWLTLYLETVISQLSWKSATSATIALQYKRNAKEWINKTDKDSAFLIPFLCHDFSARGLSPFDMLASGLGHATSFRGSDSIICIPGARYYYEEPENEVIINSVNASEHSVSTTKIFTVGESQMIADWLEIFKTGILSIVSDTFDLWKLITEYLPANKEAIMARDGKLVIRPDSGDPVDIVCGTVKQFHQSLNEAKTSFVQSIIDKIEQNNTSSNFSETTIVNVNGAYFELKADIEKLTLNNQNYTSNDLQISVLELESKPEYKGVIELLWDIFGGTLNTQGYKLLDSHIGAIYGDSITLERQEQIYKRLAHKGFAASNIVLGIGSYTYQLNTRDTFGFAAKGANFTTDDGKSYPIYKDPITDDGTKKSLKGYQKVDYDHNGEIIVISDCSEEEEKEGLLHTIYENGEFYNLTTFTEIRNKIDSLL